jgi:hypothetical protein
MNREERLKRITENLLTQSEYAGDSAYCVCGDQRSVHAVFCHGCLRLIADTLKASAEEDDEPVTEEWLLGIGFDCVSVTGTMEVRSPYRGHYDHPLRHTSAAVDINGNWHANGLGCAPCKTRGQVLRLLSALGITQSKGGG